MKQPLSALILAAGQGTRMKTALPKVLHRCLDLPLIAHSVKKAQEAGCSPIVVVVSPSTHDAIVQCLATYCTHAPVVYAIQPQAQGTADAVRCGLEQLPTTSERVCILYGDVPLLRSATLEQLIAAQQTYAVSVLTSVTSNPSGYGRIVRDREGEIEFIVEHKDASETQLEICEINAGIYVCDVALLRKMLTKISTHNAQNEYYLTDIVRIARYEGGVTALCIADFDEARGVNDLSELAYAQNILRLRVIHEHQKRGVRIEDMQGTYIGADVRIDPNTTIGMGVQIYGQTHIGEYCTIEGPSILRDVRIERGCHIFAFSHLEEATLHEHAHVGPFARIRPNTVLGEKTKIGNFVEIKNSTLAAHSKANHLSYLGDAQIGAHVNIGAGTITCNYDGEKKHQTTIHNGVFVGSNTTLVAPVELGEQSYIAAGSTITKNVTSQSLAFGRARQEERIGWKRKK